MLLQLRQNTGYMDGHWAAAAAGHVERGETAYDAARREAAEELGLDGLDLVFEVTMQRTQGGEPIDERVDFFFTARSWEGEPRIVEPDKCAELRWCRLDDAARARWCRTRRSRSAGSAAASATSPTVSTRPTTRPGGTTMNNKDLGPLPDPVIEGKEPNPGGVDAIDETRGRRPGPRPDPEDNPAVDDVLPTRSPSPTTSSRRPRARPTTRSRAPSRPDAGQESEDGSVEPPA